MKDLFFKICVASFTLADLVVDHPHYSESIRFFCCFYTESVICCLPHFNAL